MKKLKWEKKLVKHIIIALFIMLFITGSVVGQPLETSLQYPQPSAVITSLSASELAEKIKIGELTAQEVTEAFIHRIEEVNPKINAVIIPVFNEARAQAIEADQKQARGEPLSPLHGVPVTIKEQYRVAGTQTTLGATSKIGNVYHDEGPLVKKLREAGAIILGKTNVTQTLAGWEADNRVYGRTNNPWNLNRTSGGSSGGEAAIIAAGGSPLGLGGDLGGSIRIPSHFCGVNGIKPTSYRLTNDDFSPGLLGNGQELFIPQPGPMARTVADLELAMKIFAETSGELSGDLVPPVPWSDPENIQIEGLRVGMYKDNGYFTASPALRRAVEEAADALRGKGAIVEPITPPDAAEGIRLFLGAVTAGGGEHFKELLGDEKPIPQLDGMFQGLGKPPFVLSIVQKIMEARGQHFMAYQAQCIRSLSTIDYWNLVEDRNDYRARFLQTMDEGNFDVIICPPAALPALTHGSSGHLFPAFTYSFVYNVLGAPAGVVAATRVRPGEESDREVTMDMADITAFEVERGSAGLPVGVQVISRYWREDIVLAVMSTLEEHFRTTPDYPENPVLVSD